MPGAWSRVEVEAAVADYFAMLGAELRGKSYNKAAHRRALQENLHNRSEPAIERKHQNISAILIELGFVYIAGYKPLGNYQQLLMEVVADRLETERALSETLKRQVEAEAALPSVDEILDTLQSPPTPRQSISTSRTIHDRTTPLPKVNYLELEARNRSLGGAGEEFVVRFEKARLARLGKEALVERVERVSETRGDGLGFDVLSFDESGSDRLIEVKTTAYGASTPFFVTPKELRVSLQKQDRYHIYRPYAFRKAPRLFILSGAIEKGCVLEPSEYRATVGRP